MTLGHFRGWELLLLAVLVAIVAMNIARSPYYLGVGNIVNLFQLSIEKIIVALMMTLIIVNAEIDLSVASIMGLAAAVMAWLFQLGVPLPLAILAAMISGALGGPEQRLLDRLSRAAFARRDARRADRLPRHRPHPPRGPGGRQLSGMVQCAGPAAAARPAHLVDHHLPHSLRRDRDRAAWLGARPSWST